MKKLITTADFLRAYSEGRIGWKTTADGIGVIGRRAVVAVMLECGFPPPVQEPDEHGSGAEDRA